MSLLLSSIAVLGLTGLAGAAVLYATARKFRVDEDPRIDAVESQLPGANCGACGRRGCRDFACAVISSGSLDGLHCPGAGAEAMAEIARIIGVAETGAPRLRNIAVLRCNGSCKARPEKYEYDGAETCAIMDATGVGSRGCSYGCLGCGDCVAVCRFGALRISPDTGLPEVDADACTGCGLCVTECPRRLIELRPEGLQRSNGSVLQRRVWVACSNRDRGAAARKDCAAACIGCGKCAKVCAFGAVSVTDNLAYIDPALCKTCGKCVAECPTGAILSTMPRQDKKSE